MRVSQYYYDPDDDTGVVDVDKIDSMIEDRTHHFLVLGNHYYELNVDEAIKIIKELEGLFELNLPLLLHKSKKDE